MSRSLATIAVACALLLSIPGHAAPGDMSVAEFLTRTEALQERGALAMFSSDLGVLRGEVEASSTAYRARLAADRQAGRPADSCPPPAGSARINSDDLLRHMRTYPSARRSTLTVREAIADMMRRKYPCSR